MKKQQLKCSGCGEVFVSARIVAGMPCIMFCGGTLQIIFDEWKIPKLGE